MIALILAAGRGTRLRQETASPKCLLDIAGSTLLNNYLASLETLGLSCRIVIGYQGHKIEEHVRAMESQLPVSLVKNPDFSLGSVLSLDRALENIEEAVLLLDGDVFFHPEVLTKLVQSSHQNALLVDFASQFTGEEYMVGMEGGRVRALHRSNVDSYSLTGEWVGFARFGPEATQFLRDTVKDMIRRGDTQVGYEQALTSLINRVEVGYEEVGALPWIEIDFPEDLERARKMAQSFPPAHK